MSSFFDPPPLPERPPEPRRRPWAGRQDAVIGWTVALNLVIGRSDKAALWVPALTACVSGFEFGVEVRHDLDEEEFMHPFFDGPYTRRRRKAASEGLDPELLRFGIQFSDGRKATTIEGHIRPRTPDEPMGVSDGPVLSARGGGGGGGRWRQDFWVSPLPPEGPLTFVAEWPAVGVPETRNDIDSALVRAAAAEAHPLWSGTEPRGDSGGSTTQRVVLSASPDEAPEPPDPDAAPA